MEHSKNLFEGGATNLGMTTIGVLCISQCFKLQPSFPFFLILPLPFHSIHFCPFFFFLFPPLNPAKGLWTIVIFSGSERGPPAKRVLLHSEVKIWQISWHKKTHTKPYIGRSRSSKVVDFGNNRKGVYATSN